MSRAVAASLAMLKSKVAIVTGSSSGIGAGTAIKFAQEGAAGVVLHGRKEDALKKVQEQVEKAGQGNTKVHVVVGDITEQSVRERLITETIDHFGRLDALVNNAGISMSAVSTAECPIDVYDNIFNVNVRSVILVTQLAIPHLVKTKGAIVNISSVAALKANPVFTVYNMAKIALDHFTRCLAVELGPKGVRVNSVQPGAIPDTELASRYVAKSDNFDQFMKMVVDRTPLRRTGQVEEVANLIAFLSSDRASFITGIGAPVDGGLFIS